MLCSVCPQKSRKHRQMDSSSQRQPKQTVSCELQARSNWICFDVSRGVPWIVGDAHREMATSTAIYQKLFRPKSIFHKLVNRVLVLVTGPVATILTAFRHYSAGGNYLARLSFAGPRSLGSKATIPSVSQPKRFFLFVFVVPTNNIVVNSWRWGSAIFWFMTTSTWKKIFK